MREEIKKVDLEIERCIRARYPLIYIVSPEERRVEKALTDIAERLDMKIFIWSYQTGFMDNQKVAIEAGDPIPALDHVQKSKNNAIFVLKDFHPFLNDTMNIRKLRDCINSIFQSLKSLIVLSPVLNLPIEIEKDATVIDYPLPNYKEIEGILEHVIEDAESQGATIRLNTDEKEQIIKALQGLTEVEVRNVLYKASVDEGGLNSDDIPTILMEKEQIVRKSGILEFFPAKETMSDVGGLDILKEWLKKEKMCFSEEARKRWHLDTPKGALFIGVPGCGKSHTAKAVSTLWQYPLLRLDVGKVFGGIVGSSEENMRKAIRTAESIAPCILWIDELEKGFSGMQSSGALDSGVTARVFGTFITWMQEKTAQVFVVATANNISQLPPELLRKGRFDEVFFLDLPTEEERHEIFKIHLTKRKLDPSRFDLGALAKHSDGFSGSEIESVIKSGIKDSMYEVKETTTDHVVKNIKDTVPLSSMMKQRIEEMRSWAKNSARPASIVKKVVDIKPENEYRRILKLS